MSAEPGAVELVMDRYVQVACRDARGNALNGTRLRMRFKPDSGQVGLNMGGGITAWFEPDDLIEAIGIVTNIESY